MPVPLASSMPARPPQDAEGRFFPKAAPIATLLVEQRIENRHEMRHGNGEGRVLHVSGHEVQDVGGDGQ